jgi:rhodanese-related sulfurtransferase
MKDRKLIKIFLFLGVFGILLSGLVLSQPKVAAAEDSQFEVIRQAADRYLSSGKADTTIEANDLWSILSDNNRDNYPYILSTRKSAQDVTFGHICGANMIPYRMLLFESTLMQLPPKDRNIVVYSNTGQEGGGQTTALLNMLGWNSVNLKWGFTSWMLCPDTAPGIFRMQIHGGVGMDFTTDTNLNQPGKSYDFPVINNTSSKDAETIIKAAADKYFRRQIPPQTNYKGMKVFYRPSDIKPGDLFTLLHDGDTGNDPFILDVREPDYYAKGHIAGAVNIPLKDVAKQDNLRKLPPIWQKDTPANNIPLASIVVVSNDGMAGSQVAGILNYLGYDAINLLFGMTGWTTDENIAPGRFDEEIIPGTTKRVDILEGDICQGQKAGTNIK